MADTKISDLSAGTTLAGTEVAPFVQSGATVKTTANQIRAHVLTSPVTLVGNATAGSEVRFVEDTDNGSNYISLKAPDNIGGNVTFTLPSADGTNGQALVTNASGVLSFATAGAAAPLTLAGGTVTDPSTPLTITQTWNDAADTFIGTAISITNTASAAASKAFSVQVGGADIFYIGPSKTTAQSWKIGLEEISGYGDRADAASESNRNIYIRGTATAMINLSEGGIYGWNEPGSVNASPDTRLYRIAASVVGVRNNSTSAGGALNFIEQTAPSAPGADQVVIYAEDNGSGKTRLMARFASGAAQQIAIEP